MGVGKGTIARALVKATDYFSIDTDDLIESVENKKIKKIFKEEGEPYFRSLEKKCALWLEKNVDNTIISTGGGFFRQENIHNIGKVIYLESSFEGILNRIHSAPNAKVKLKKRPLLSNLEEAKTIYKQRIEDYKKVADVTVNVENRDIDDIIKDILGNI
ncbi:shikimate kinase [Halarcobacter sp.]|uniref:shikimate kinase n=1 Tax=Halarcobacter sp. TaxID=2321133 RepID=UPI0029F4BB20|nr:shikimate kinase [Halarcobacter sp.]